jgi:hypothetical protein
MVAAGCPYAVAAAVKLERVPRDGVCVLPWRRLCIDVASSTFHSEEETVVHMLKQVRMPPSTTTPVGVIFLGGGDGGCVSCSIVSRGNPNLGEATIDIGVCGRPRPRWRSFGALLDRMMATLASSPP